MTYSTIFRIVMHHMKKKSSAKIPKQQFRNTKRNAEFHWQQEIIIDFIDT